MALTKQDGGAVRQKPAQELLTEAVSETLGTCGGHVSFIFYFPFLFSSVLFFFVILLLFFIPCFLVINFLGEPHGMQGLLCTEALRWHPSHLCCVVVPKSFPSAV